MKKTIKFCCAALAFLSLFIPFVQAYQEKADTTPKNWSVCREKDHKQPSLSTDFRFITDNGGYYIDNNVTEDKKVIYLTFDAGYENGNVEKILDTLKAHNAPGAFFVLENLIKRDTELVKRMSDEGHLVCNHTARHKDMTKITDINAFKEELDKLNEVYKEYTGREMAKYYRPPEGRFSEQNLAFANELGYKTIFWSCAYADWDNNKQPDKQKSIQKLLDNTHNGMVLLLHPTSATNAAILDTLLCEWEKQGYTFGTLDELVAK